MSQVVTRFAPSPTGLLHIGGARTALVQLAVRQPSRRQVPAADRGHRPRALDGGRGRGHSRRACIGSASPGTARRCCQFERARRHREVARAVARERAAPIAATPRRRNSRRCASAQRRKASRCATTGAGAIAIPLEAPAGRVFPRSGCAPPGRRDRGRRPGARAGYVRQPRTRRPRSCCVRTAIRPISSRWSSTITTWASRTSSAATTT